MPKKRDKIRSEIAGMFAQLGRVNPNYYKVKLYKSKIYQSSKKKLPNCKAD